MIAETAGTKPTSKIIQILNQDDKLLALCEDGSIWKHYPSYWTFTTVQGDVWAFGNSPLKLNPMICSSITKDKEVPERWEKIFPKD